MDKKLQSQEYIQEIDKHKVYDMIFTFPEQIQEAIKIFRADSVNLKPYYDFNNVLICGMGGSAISGDIVSDFLKDTFHIPILVNREHKLPKYIDKKTLVIAISYSGNTSETLEMVEDSISRGSYVTGITSGGKLEELLEQLNLPIFKVPPGLPPRHSLGYLFSILFLIISHIFKFSSPEVLVETAEFLKQKRELFVFQNKVGNMAKAIAVKMQDSYPFIYSYSRHFGSVVKRWKTQMNENAKHLVSYDLFPELTHNEIVAWEFPHKIKSLVIFLRDNKEDEDLSYHIESTTKLMKANELIEVITEGRSLLERMMYLIYLGDWTSFYLAILKGLDPFDIKNIDILKQELQKRKEEA